MKENYPLSRKTNVVVQELDGEILIYDLDINKALCLNATSALVWNLCDGNKSITEISESVGKKLNAPASEDLVWLAIDQLKKEKLIENETELISPFLGMNRREVIKKIGLGTMIVLPIVAGIVAPTAANAATCPGPAGFKTLNDGDACSASCQCKDFPLGTPTPCCKVTSTTNPTRCRAGGGGCIAGTTV